VSGIGKRRRRWSGGGEWRAWRGPGGATEGATAAWSVRRGFDPVQHEGVNTSVNGEYAWKHMPPTLLSKECSLVRKLRDDYNGALAKYDVLAMPAWCDQSAATSCQAARAHALHLSAPDFGSAMRLHEKTGRAHDGWPPPASRRHCKR
jgi:hypothetical protein